jgi:hypothetical protein
MLKIQERLRSELLSEVQNNKIEGTPILTIVSFFEKKIIGTKVTQKLKNSKKA